MMDAIRKYLISLCAAALLCALVRALVPGGRMKKLCSLLCGILLTALLTARFVNHLLETHYALVYHVILGVVCASTLMIVPLHYDSVSQGIACAACALAGFAAAMALDRFGDGVKEKNRV